MNLSGSTTLTGSSNWQITVYVLGACFTQPFISNIYFCTFYSVHITCDWLIHVHRYKTAIKLTIPVRKMAGKCQQGGEVGGVGEKIPPTVAYSQGSLSPTGEARGYKVSWYVRQKELYTVYVKKRQVAMNFVYMFGHMRYMYLQSTYSCTVIYSIC